MANIADMELASLLQQGASYVYAAHSICSLNDVPPIGRVPAGTSMQQFWHLGPAPVSGWSHLFIPLPHQPDFNKPEVSTLLQEMMAVRRTSPADLKSLVARINFLPQRLGRQDGGFIAATLLSRVGQALSEPTAFPPLLTNTELRKAYAEAKGLGAMTATASQADSTLTVAATAVATASQAMPDHWAGRIVQKIVESGPGQLVTQQGLAIAQKWSAYKKVGVGAAVWICSKFILGYATDYQAAYAQAFRDEMIRRGLPAP